MLLKYKLEKIRRQHLVPVKVNFNDIIKWLVQLSAEDFRM